MFINLSFKWTVPQLSITVIYYNNGSWSVNPMDKGYIVR